MKIVFFFLLSLASAPIWAAVAASNTATAARASAVTSPEEPARSELVALCVKAHFHACGLIDRHGEWRVTPRYSHIQRKGGYWIAERESGLAGVLDANGVEIIKPTFAIIGEYHTGIAPASLPGPRGQLVGYIDTEGNWVIEPQFLYHTKFNGSAALVWKGPTYEQRQLGLLTREGRFTPLPYDDDFEAADGRFVVQKTQDESVQYIGLNSKGLEVLRAPKYHRLHIGPHGTWVIQPDVEGKAPEQWTSRVLDSKGRTLFAVTGQTPFIRIDRDAAEQPQRYAIFTNNSDDDSPDGVVDLQTGKVMVQPGKLSSITISEDRIWAKADSTNDGYALFDIRGARIGKAAYRYAREFRSGRAVVYVSPKPSATASVDGGYGSDNLALVVDRDGNEIATFTALEAKEIELEAWTDTMNPSDHGMGALARMASGRNLTTLDGQLIAAIKVHEPREGCRTEIVHDARGKIIWPTYQSVSAAANCESARAGNEAELKDGAARFAFRERMTFEGEIARERARVTALGGGIENLISREFTEQLERVKSLPWIAAPETVNIGSHEIESLATLKLAGNMKFLDAQQLKANDGVLAPPGTVPTDTMVLAGEDFRWIAFLSVMQTGHVDIQRPIAPPEELLQNLRAWRVGSPSSRPGRSFGLDQSYSWEIEPSLDRERRRLVYSVKFIDYASGGRASILSIMRFSREHTLVARVIFSGLLRMNDANRYKDEIAAAIDDIELSESERYDHSRRELHGTPATLNTLIAGVATEHELTRAANTKTEDDERSASDGHSERSMWGLVAILAMIVAVVVSARSISPKRSRN